MQAITQLPVFWTSPSNGLGDWKMNDHHLMQFLIMLLSQSNKLTFFLFESHFTLYIQSNNVMLLQFFFLTVTPGFFNGTARQFTAQFYAFFIYLSATQYNVPTTLFNFFI